MSLDFDFVDTMAPRSRTRTRQDSPIEGSGFWHGVPITGSYTPRSEICEDVTGNKGGVNPFSKTTYGRSGGLLTGKNTNGTFVANGLPVTYSRGSFMGAPNISSANYGNRMLAQSGPLTPRLYLPVSVFELRDVPKMLKHAGDLLGKIYRPGKTGGILNPGAEAASATLAYQFGWAPLIEDIGKMLDFADEVKKRQRMLARAHTKKGVRRKIGLGKDSVSSAGSETVWSTYGVTLRQNWHGTKSYKRWATITWTVRDESQYGRIPTFTDGFRNALGLNNGHIPIAVWKALPWSWAIDWFADISNILQANYNMIYYKPSRGCVMTHFRNDWTYTTASTSSGQFEASTAHTFEERKMRTPFNPSTNVSLKLPFLDNFKLSIVGSMTILALSRR